MNRNIIHLIKCDYYYKKRAKCVLSLCEFPIHKIIIIFFNSFIDHWSTLFFHNFFLIIIVGPLHVLLCTFWPDLFLCEREVWRFKKFLPLCVYKTPILLLRIGLFRTNVYLLRRTLFTSQPKQLLFTPVYSSNTSFANCKSFTDLPKCKLFFI